MADSSFSRTLIGWSANVRSLLEEQQHNVWSRLKMAVVLWKLDCRNSWQLGTCNIFLLLFCSWIWYLELKSVFCSFLWFMDDRVREFFNFFFNFFLSLSDIFWWCLFLTVSSELWLYNMLCANAMERNAFQMNWPNDYRQRMVTVKFCIKWKLCSKIKKQNHSFVDNFSSNNNKDKLVQLWYTESLVY